MKTRLMQRMACTVRCGYYGTADSITLTQFMNINILVMLTDYKLQQPKSKQQ